MHEICFMLSSYYRLQQCPTSQHAMRRASYLISKDIGGEKDSNSSSTAFETRNNSTYSNPTHTAVLDKDIRIGPMRPSRFLEKKRWPPSFETISSQWKVKGSTNTNITRDNIAVANTNGTRQFQSSSEDLVRNSNSFKPEFEPPFRLEVTF